MSTFKESETITKERLFSECEQLRQKLTRYWVERRSGVSLLQQQVGELLDRLLTESPSDAFEVCLTAFENYLCYNISNGKKEAEMPDDEQTQRLEPSTRREQDSKSTEAGVVVDQDQEWRKKTREDVPPAEEPKDREPFWPDMQRPPEVESENDQSGSGQATGDNDQSGSGQATGDNDQSGSGQATGDNDQSGS